MVLTLVVSSCSLISQTETPLLEIFSNGLQTDLSGTKCGGETISSFMGGLLGILGDNAMRSPIGVVSSDFFLNP